MTDFDSFIEQNDGDGGELNLLHKILRILTRRDIKNLPPDFFVNLNFIVDTYTQENKIEFLLKLLEEMTDDEIIGFVHNSGERRNRPRLFIINDVEVDVYGGFFRKMVDYIIEQNPDICKTVEKRQMFFVLQNLFADHLKKFFDKEKLFEKFVGNYEKILKDANK